MKHLKQFNESSSGNPNDFIIKNEHLTVNQRVLNEHN